jgi:hypothetical protein
MSQWDETDANIAWSLGGQSDVEGRRIMREALAQGNIAFMGDFKSGFYRTQGDDHVQALFNACCRDDERRVYNMGRSHNGQPPI